MKAKHLIAMMMITAAPVVGNAQTASGLHKENLDRTVAPGTDFYDFATAGWRKNNPLPPAYSSYGAFNILNDDNQKRINSILSSFEKKTYKGNTVEAKLANFYKLAMDSARREREGIAPVKPLLDEIEAAKTKADLLALQQKYAMFGYGVFYNDAFGADEKNVSMNIYNLSQGGLTLGQKDYYLDNDEAMVKIRNAYREHIARMFQVYGFTKEQAEARRDAVFRTETALALVSRSRTELRDPQANYNKMTLDEFKKNYPNIPVEALANAEGINSQFIQEMIVGQPNFFAGLDKITSAMTADDLRAAMEWDVIMGSASYLSDEVREANFDFFGKTLSGRKEDYPLWKRATNHTQSAMGEALGKIYCQRYFPASSKKMMEQLVENLRVALGQRIDAQSWMSPETKANAHRKLSTFYVKIGYPNKWKDYSTLDIDPAKSFYDNVKACKAWRVKKHIEEKAGKPVDREEWYMTPQTVNAYYNPTTNEICFPAGILQSPYFDPNADDACNYGAIGVVIGHEMTHGFDDQGRNFDHNGNMVDWWTAEDAAKFQELANKLGAQYSAEIVADGVHANGNFTMGENIADHGGLRVAYSAFKKTNQGKGNEKIDGFTPDQRFFLSYANVWAANITKEEMLRRTKQDPHSLGVNRVNVAIRNLEEFFNAFNVMPGMGMWRAPEDRVIIW
jgi:putative endopeptidase